MSDELVRDVQDLWQAQPREARPVSIDEFRAQVRHFARRARWLNALTSAAAFLVLVGDPWSGGRDAQFARLGWLMLLGGLIYVGHHARDYRKWLQMPATLGLHQSSDFYGFALMDDERGIGRHPWRYVAAIWPGVILTAFELGFDPPLVIRLPMFAAGAAVVLFLVWFNAREERARRRPAEPR